MNVHWLEQTMFSLLSKVCMEDSAEPGKKGETLKAKQEAIVITERLKKSIWTLTRVGMERVGDGYECLCKAWITGEGGARNRHNTKDYSLGDWENGRIINKKKKNTEEGVVWAKGQGQV